MLASRPVEWVMIRIKETADGLQVITPLMLGRQVYRPSGDTCDAS
jgi:hypothetical protein